MRSGSTQLLQACLIAPAESGHVVFVSDGPKLSQKLIFVSSQYGEKVRIVHSCLHALGDRSSTSSENQVRRGPGATAKWGFEAFVYYEKLIERDPHFYKNFRKYPISQRFVTAE